jgi:lipoprotein-anchoring transpeptidase ErfK/SrfK
MTLRRGLGTLVAAILLASPALVACTHGDDGTDTAKRAAPPPAPTIALSAAAAGATSTATNLPIAAEVVSHVGNGWLTSIKVTDDKGAAIAGAMRADGSSWVPAKPLAYKKTYTVTATAAGAAGQVSVGTSTFTTMAKPARLADSWINVFPGQTYGTAMPIVVDFGETIPVSAREAIQKRLFVTSTPSQPGAWHWMDSGTEVAYRTPDYWKPVPFGNNIWGTDDSVASAAIGNSVHLDIDNGTKQMAVWIDGKMARKIPVAMGKPSTPTSSGKMVIMEKDDYVTFDTRNDPQGGYVVTVANAQRLTWGGEFIHSAPWSEGDQGYRNVSHGCTNVSSWAAGYLMGITHVGDLVTIQGTEVHLAPGNGWTVWDMTWDEFVKGSALPVPVDLKPAPPKPAAAPTTPAPSPSPTD